MLIEHSPRALSFIAQQQNKHDNFYCNDLYNYGDDRESIKQRLENSVFLSPSKIAYKFQL